MSETIFRKKSIESLSAPEELTGYLRVTGPGVWAVLCGIGVLLAGLLVWGVFGTILSRKTVPVLVSGGTVSCYVLDDDVDPSGQEIDIRVGDVLIKADPGEAQNVILDASDDSRLFESGYLSPGKSVSVLTGETDLKDGFYEAVITTEKLKPLSLLFSKK